MMRATLDEQLGIVRSLSVGFTGDDDVRVYADQMVALMAAARRKGVPFLHLVDATQAQVHSREAATLLNALAAEWHDPRDRTAVILNSSLLRMQMQRTSSQASAGTFATEEEALAWLLDPSARPLARMKAS